jgi:signal transduction histidine kinase
MSIPPNEKELNFNLIIEQSREGILIVDIEGVIRFANPAAHSLLNQKKADLVGQSFGRPLDDDKAIEMGIVRLNAKIGVGEMRLGETMWEGKKAFLVLLLDVTELKRAQEDLQLINDQLEKRVDERTSEILRYSRQLKTANEELFKANQDLERFAYIASHDLQEPLRKILTYGEMLVGHEVLDPKYKDYILRMTKSAQGMTHLVESLLQYSRLPHEFSIEDCDLNEILDEVAATLELKIAETKTTLIYSNLVHVRANKAQMSHLFQNLVENAIKFAQKGLPSIIRVESRATASGTELSITDNGIGIDVQHAEKIFEPFQRLHPRADYEGSGIGLSIVKKIIENHDGTVRVEQAHPFGATFILTLPAIV